MKRSKRWMVSNSHPWLL